MIVMGLYIFSPHVCKYFLKYNKKEPFGIVWNFAFEILDDISLKVTLLICPGKLTCVYAS